MILRTKIHLGSTVVTDEDRGGTSSHRETLLHSHQFPGLGGLIGDFTILPYSIPPRPPFLSLICPSPLHLFSLFFCAHRLSEEVGLCGSKSSGLAVFHKCAWLVHEEEAENSWLKFRV